MEEVKIPLRYWVDNTNSRVIVAEASGEFIDVLFSFLTLPLGTIIRLWDSLDQVGRENIIEQVRPDNNSEQQIGPDNISEQQVRPENNYEQVGTHNISEQQARICCINKLCCFSNNCEPQVRRENISEQQVGPENISEQQARHCPCWNKCKQQARFCCINRLCPCWKKSEQQVGLGCINKLYQSVNKLEPHDFRNDNGQKMLRCPRNPLESSCQRLKVNVDDTESTKYFMCHNCLKKESKLFVSSFLGVKCECGSLLRREIEMLEESNGDDDGVFVKGKAMFLIYDNLTVRRSSPCESIKPSLKHGHKKLENQKEELFDRKKILSLLKQALTSKTPLSDVLLGNKKSKRSVSFARVIGSSGSNDYLEIKVMVSKSKNKILFVEADGDFVDFLATFLTTPLGSIMNLKNDKLSCCLKPLAYILKLKNGKLSLGSIRNLYKSVKNLDPSWFTESSNKSLLNPKVASHFGCERNPLLIASQDETGKYWYGLREEKNEKGRIISEKKMISIKHDMLKEPKDIILLDPRSSDGVGFIKRPCLFVVSDDLELSQMTNTGSTSGRFMDNHPFIDLEEHLVKIRKSEALNLLRASLTSDKGAFTQGLSFLLWKWRFQRLFPCSGFLRKKKNEKEEKRKRRKSYKKEKKKQGEIAVETT